MAKVEVRELQTSFARYVKKPLVRANGNQGQARYTRLQARSIAVWALAHGGPQTVDTHCFYFFFPLDATT